jgi:hypothetical protein
VVRIGQDAVRIGKRTVRYFIFYAHADTTLKNALVQRLRPWLNAASTAGGAAVGFRVHMLGQSEFVSMTPDRKRIIQVSPGAWRDLGWLVRDATGALIRYPAEMFGPLPEYREDRTPPQ